MRSAWASGLHLRSRTDEKRGAGHEVNTFKQNALIHDGYERTWHATPGLCGTQTKGVMEAFLVSAGVVALAEIGDKTQLLALVLAARFRAPVPVICGILTATLVNHFAAGAVGTLLAARISPTVLRYLLAASFLATAVWMLIPDRHAAADARPARFGAYGSSLIAFFLMEIGDRTQIATVALAAKYNALLAVVAGNNLRMVLLGEAAPNRLPLKWVHRAAAGAFVVLALLVLFGVRL